MGTLEFLTAGAIARRTLLNISGSGKEMSESIHAHLTATKHLILDPENWTQSSNARNAEGLVVCVSSPSVARMSLIGALHQGMLAFEMSDSDKQRYYDAFTFLASTIRLYGGSQEILDGIKSGALDHYLTVSRFNDISSHPEVIAILDKALARLRGVSAPPEDLSMRMRMVKRTGKERLYKPVGDDTLLDRARPLSETLTLGDAKLKEYTASARLSSWLIDPYNEPNFSYYIKHGKDHEETRYGVVICQ